MKKQIANRYQISQHLHRLGETDYYAANDTMTQTPVTLRVIDTSEVGAVGIGLEDFAPDKLRRKMDNEQRLLEQLKDPGLLTILAVGFDDPLYYHVYPAFVFHNLQMHIQQHGRVQNAVAYIRQAAQTLENLHQNRIIHCDISAETLLLLNERVKIVEFTIANHDPVDGMAPGDPPYMSPEAITGTKPAPPRDIWALGVTLYYALSGKLPFGELELPREVGAPRLFQKIMQDTPPPLTDDIAPPHISALIDGMLAKDPTQRPTIAAIIAELDR